MAKTARPATARKAARDAAAREAATGVDLTKAGAHAADDPTLTPRQRREAETKANLAGAHRVLPAIPQAKNPPDQPFMVPAKQVPGAILGHLDPDDLPANQVTRGAAIRVQARALGYYGDALRRVGDVFDIASETEFSTKWMRRVAESTPTVVTGSNAALHKAKQGEDVNKVVEPARPVGDDNVLDA